jgi:hypothetical protein
MCQKILLNPKTFLKILGAMMLFFYVHYHLQIFPLKPLKYISTFNIPIYLGAQGYLRQLKHHKVILKPWNDFQKFLKYIQMVFIDEVEAKVIMDKKEVMNSMLLVKNLSHFGPEEVIITRGDRGAMIYSSYQSIPIKYQHFHPSKLWIQPG